MKKNVNKEITVKCIYKEDGANIEQILTKSVLVFVKGEVQKLCCHPS